MKRKTIVITLLALLVLSPVLARAGVGKFTSVAGNVDVTPPGGVAVQAAVGGEINEGDIIRTKTQAKVEVAFQDGSILRLAENSRLRVSAFAGSQERGERQATLYLFRGIAQSIVRVVKGADALSAKYEVHTPTSVHGVRGTQFFAYHQAGVSGALVTEGTVYAFSAQRPEEVRTIGPGLATVIADPRLPPFVKTTTEAEVERYRRATDPSEKPRGKTSGAGLPMHMTGAMAPDEDDEERLAEEGSAEENSDDGRKRRHRSSKELERLNDRIKDSDEAHDDDHLREAFDPGVFAESNPPWFFSDLRGGEGELSARVSGTAALWAGATTPVTMTGAWRGDQGLWSAPFFSRNLRNGNLTTFDGGAYRGFSSFLLAEGQGVDAGLIALYVDPRGQAGYLIGALTGTDNPALQSFTGAGALRSIEMGAASLKADDLFNRVTESGQKPLSLAGPPASLDFLSEARNEAQIRDIASWGIWQSLLAFKEGPVPASWSWQTASGTAGTYWTTYTDVTRIGDGSQLTGLVAGVKADWVNASTFITGGEVRGLFDPARAVWQALSQGVTMETGRFLQMTLSNQAALQALNIPAIQVGAATLTQGAGTINNLSNVRMDNVRFFATSTGSVPKIWATNAVVGDYSAAPALVGQAGFQAVPLSGGGLSANFEVRNWNPSAGTWGANITGGTGTLSGVRNGTVNFQGGAAGRLSDGTFTGTGAGIVK